MSDPPTAFHATAALRHLAQRRRLDSLWARLPEADRLPQEQGRRFAMAMADSLALTTTQLGEANAQWLQAEELIAPGAPPTGEARLPFVFVRAINLELSYSCNLACSHCLQTPLRPKGQPQWLDPALVRSLLEQAVELDLLGMGLNVTGGETFAAGSPLLEVLENAAGLELPVRANTNAWWGLQQNIRLGERLIADDEALVALLQRSGLGRLALSLDDRYQQYPELLERLVRVATLCERQGLAYEFVSTDADPEAFKVVLQRIAGGAGSLTHARVTPMEMVDIGSAAPRQHQPLACDGLAALARRSDCGTAGFHRPTYLHVNPEGGVRSCLYAPGAGWHGDLNRQSLRSILNAAASNPVLQLFERGELGSFVARHLDPWRHLYRQVEHGCGAAALIARLAEQVAELQASAGGAPTEALPDAVMEPLHQQLAAEMGLAAGA